MVEKSIMAFIATLGFGLLVNIRGKNLFLAALGGAISWFAFLLISSYHASVVISCFIAAIIAGAYSEILARSIKVPATVFAICAIIPLVPGSGMYYTMFEVISNNMEKAAVKGFETISVAGAIAVGLFVVSVFTQIVRYWYSRIKKTIFIK